MTPHQFLQAAAVLLLLIAAIVSFFSPVPEPRRGWGHSAGWLGLAAYVLAGLVP